MLPRAVRFVFATIVTVINIIRVCFSRKSPYLLRTTFDGTPGEERKKAMGNFTGVVKVLMKLQGKKGKKTMKNSMVGVKGLKEFQGVKFVKIILRRGGGTGYF